LLTHAGETSFFRSQLYLLLQDGLGLYVAYNAPGGGPARQALIQAFFDRFYPAPSTGLSQAPTRAALRANQARGRYVSTRSAQTTVEKLRLLLEPSYQPITVRAKDGYLESDHPAIRSQNPASYQSHRWMEMEPGYYKQTNGHDSMVSRPDEHGNPMLFLDSTAPRGYRRLSWSEELAFQPLLPLGLMVVVLGIAVFALADRQAVPAARWLAVGNGAILLAFLLGLAGFALLGFRAFLLGEVSLVWWVVFTLPVVVIILTISLAVVTLLPWPETAFLRRAPYALTVFSMAGLLWWANYWNLIGWRF
jgi:hypothetical protein